MSKIQHRGCRYKKFTEKQKQENSYYAKTRNKVESVFGIWKLHYRARKCRYLGIARNKVQFYLIAMSYNLKLAVGILKRRLLL